MARPVVPIVRLPHAEGLELPAYATAGSSGCDLCAAIRAPVMIWPKQRVLIPTGLCLALPEGLEGQVRGRSGLALEAGVVVLNAPGTIDADYRGEVRVILANFGEREVMIRRGDRIAQLVVAPVVQVAWEVRASLDDTPRGDGGFGSTGV